MARIRTIKPSFFESPTIARLPLRARLTFVGLWCYVDDAGRGFDDARLIKAAVWPLADDVTRVEVDDDLVALEAEGLIERWMDETKGRSLLRVRSLLEHQKINRPTASRLPPSPNEYSMTAHAPLTEPSPQEEEEEGKGSGGGGGSTPEPVDAIERETQARVARRRAKGEDIGPRLIEIIRGDVARDLKQNRPVHLTARPDCGPCGGSGWVEDEIGDAQPCTTCRLRKAS